MPKFVGLDVSGFAVGQVVSVGHDTIPFGTLECDGSALSRTTYATLFAKIGTRFGIGDGSTTFNLPDLRGKFLRGLDATSGSFDLDRASRAQAIFPATTTWTLANCVTTSGQQSVTVTSTANLSPGMSVTGTGISANTVVLSITNATSFLLGSQTRGNVTASNSGTVTLTFSNSATAAFVGSVQGHAFQQHTHTQNSHGHSTGGVGNGSFFYTGTGGTVNLSGGANGNNGSVSVTATTATNNTTDASGTTSTASSNESRPLNITVRYAIAYI